MAWKPHVTVAAVIERDNKFLLVEEESDGQIVINQPAGHLERGETLSQAIIRETFEETAWKFTPTAIIGIYLWQHPQNSTSYLRVSFTGKCDSHTPSSKLDDGIIRALWLSREQLLTSDYRVRSPLVLHCIDDYLDGTEYPLSMLKSLLHLTR